MTRPKPFSLHSLLAASLAGLMTQSALAAPERCEAKSTAALTPVIELYTSEGCSSCPPADKWLSTLKGKPAVVQAFHVGYWDYIGWVDRFASPNYTTRQKQVAAYNRQSGIYTPQLVRNGQDWRDYDSALSANALPLATVSIRRLDNGGEQIEADVTPLNGAPSVWSAYWTVTENGHTSRVKAGENAGETLKHDFVVRQYTLAGDHRGPAHLTLRPIPADPAHPRTVNLVVFDPITGKPLQAISLPC